MAEGFGAAAAAIAAIASSAVSAASSSGGTSMYKSNKLMALQNMWQEHYLRNYYSNARQSLNKAGYNPMLAYMSHPSGGQTNATAQHGNNASAVSSSLGHLGELMQVSSGIDNTNASTGLMKEQAKTEEAKRIQMDFDNNIKKLEAAKYDKDLEWYDREHAANMLDMYYRAQYNRAQTDLSTYNAQTARIKANADAFDAETKRGTYSTHFGLGGVSNTGYMSPSERRQWRVGDYKPKPSYNNIDYNDRKYWHTY